LPRRGHQERVRNLAWAIGEVHQDHPSHLNDIPVTAGRSWLPAQLCVDLQPCTARQGSLYPHCRLQGRMPYRYGLSR